MRTAAIRQELLNSKEDDLQKRRKIMGLPQWDFDLLLGTTIAANAAGALYYLYNMTFYQKKICPYCIAGAAINLASAVIMRPVLTKSLSKLFKKR